MNAHVGRFNRSIQEELSTITKELPIDAEQFNKELIPCLLWSIAFGIHSSVRCCLKGAVERNPCCVQFVVAPVQHLAEHPPNLLKYRSFHPDVDGQASAAIELLDAGFS